MADHAVYSSGTPLPFDEIRNDNERDALDKGLCNDLLEPLMKDERFGPVSVAGAFWPSVFTSHEGHPGSGSTKHRWAGSEATVDIALYRLVDQGRRDRDPREAVMNTNSIDDCCDRVMSYPTTEFVCVTFKREGAKKSGFFLTRKTQNLRAHHVRVRRYCNSSASSRREWTIGLIPRC